MTIDDIKDPQLTDHGTRYAHLRELCDEWYAGIEAIKAKTYKGDQDKEKLKHLEIGTGLIEHRLTSMSGFFDRIYALGSAVDRINPDPESYKSCRGTELKQPYHPSTLALE